MPTSADQYKTYTMAEVERALTLPKTWWAFCAILPFATRLSLLIANKTRLKPNHITLISFVFAILSGICFVQGRYVWLVVGAILYELNYLLDCVDGTIAKLKQQGSLEGGFLDYFLDQFRNLIATFTLAYGFYRVTGDATILMLAIAYMFLEEQLLLKDAKTPALLDSAHMLLFTAPPRLLMSSRLLRGIKHWMSSKSLYQRPTMVEIDALVFFCAPLLGLVKLGFVTGICLLLALFLYQAIMFFVHARRSRSIIKRFLSPEISRIAVFGTGAGAQRFLKWAKSQKITHKIQVAADNNNDNWDRHWLDLKIINPADLSKLECDMVVITSQHGYYAISYQLADMGFQPYSNFIAIKHD